MQKLLSLLVIFSLPLLLNAQQRFSAGAVVGLTASQIDGDLSAGYNKLGFQGGLRVTARLKERTEASMEFLFSQRGCQNELIPNDFDPNPFSLTLNYVEVPIQWHFKDWLIEYDDESYNYYKVAFNVGLVYGRLIGSKTDDEFNWLVGVAPDYLKKNDVSFTLGANFFATRHLGFTVRWQRSLLLMYDARKHDPAPAAQSWNMHSLTFQTVYLF
ncbi:MAG: outer membrane beta-barrel protein [Saprospiraceae bacterium]|nr:outer membrane beta-barrel protein [Saprospiraceae bacterium]